MDIITKNIADIIPYEKNPRKNDSAVAAVAESIRQFGFKVPLVIDGNGIIVCGHTRYRACKLIGMKEIPCVIADDLSDEQIRAFRLADNKVGELAEWDYGLLDEEIALIPTIDMTEFGFEFKDENDIELPKENERMRTDRAYNLPLIDLKRTNTFYQFPILEPTQHVPEDMIGFKYIKASPRYGACVHFYIDDYQFERVWNEPERYIPLLQQFDSVLSPDFSLYMDMPRAMKIWNVFRSRLMGQLFQDAGITVIPTLQWAEPETFDFCFDGLPTDSVVSISTLGVRQSKEAMKIWRAGAEEALMRLHPSCVVLYGGMIKDFDWGDTRVVQFEHSVEERISTGVR